MKHSHSTKNIARGFVMMSILLIVAPGLSFSGTQRTWSSNGAMGAHEKSVLRDPASSEAASRFAFVDRFRDLFRDRSRVENTKGTEARNAGKFEEARNHFRKATELNPKYPRAHYNLGHMLFILGHNEEALKYLNRAVELQKNGAGFTTRGVVRLALGDIKGALEDQVDAARVAPADWFVVPYNHACAKIFDGDLAGAAESFARAKLIANPNSGLNMDQVVSEMKQKVEEAINLRRVKLSSVQAERQLQAVPCGVSLN